MAHRVNRITRSHFFYKPVTGRSDALGIAQGIAQNIKNLPSNIHLFNRPLGINLRNVDSERIADLIPHEKLTLVKGISDAMSRLKSEIKEGTYLLDHLVEEIEKLPNSSSPSPAQYNLLDSYRKKGINFSDLPENESQATTKLIASSKTRLDISPDYISGNLDKAIRLMRIFGVREKEIGLSSLFSNYLSGHFFIDAANARESESSDIVSRTKSLEEKGTSVKIFHHGVFDKKVSDLKASDLDDVISGMADAYHEAHNVSEGEIRKFFDAVLTSEENRLEQSSGISIEEMLSFFKFPESESDTMMMSKVATLEDPLKWKKTDLGQALSVLRKNIDWDAVSVGVRAMGDIPAGVLDQINKIKALSNGFNITLTSGRAGILKENQINNLTDGNILFDLQCLAVLEKKKLSSIIETAVDVLDMINKLGNRDNAVNLNELVQSRLRGESFASLLGTQGIILRNSPIAEAREKLRSLENKVSFTISDGNGNNYPISQVELGQFRRAIVLMGRGFSRPRSPERILSTIMDSIYPEINQLPKEVIEPAEHDLASIVDLSINGIPARYPLRRKWEKINMDNFAFAGSGLEPGIRNCLGCPVNVIFGKIMSAALGVGFNEILLYEATGCFEVYSGIWPYTGKKMPTVHGVFGGAPSEMLGGISEKMARVKFQLKTRIKEAIKNDADLKNIITDIVRQLRILHIGIGGDGASFDIGFGNLSNLFARLQKIVENRLQSYILHILKTEGIAEGDVREIIKEIISEGIKNIKQKAVYLAYDNEGYQNTGNQYSGGTPPGGNATTNPAGRANPIGNDMPKKRMVEIMAQHGIKLSARMGIHRPEHMARVAVRAMQDGDSGAFMHILQPCTTGWKFKADNIAYDLSYLHEAGGIFLPITIEHGVPYLEVYPTPRDPEKALLELNARFNHLSGAVATDKDVFNAIVKHYRNEMIRVLHLTGYDGEIAGSDRLNYLEGEHRIPKLNVI